MKDSINIQEFREPGVSCKMLQLHISEREVCYLILYLKRFKKCVSYDMIPSVVYRPFRCAVSACHTCYPGCAGAATPNGDDGAMSSLPGDIFETDNFLMSLLLSKVPFVVFLCSCCVLAGEVEAPAGYCPALAVVPAPVGAVSPPAWARGLSPCSQLTHHLPRGLLGLCWEDYLPVTLHHALRMIRCTGRGLVAHPLRRLRRGDGARVIP